MPFANTITTKVLDKNCYRQELSNVILTLKSHFIYSVEILFGFAWGNDYHNWTPLKVNIDQVEHEVNKAEQLKVGQLGNDDFSIILNEAEVEILFCHERDIHLTFNVHSPIVDGIMRMWDEKHYFPNLPI